MPAHQINPLHTEADPLGTNDEEDKDKFKCLYLLVETAVAVRQREKEQGNVQV
jgi:homeobox protein TGIF1